MAFEGLRRRRRHSQLARRQPSRRHAAEDGDRDRVRDRRRLGLRPRPRGAAPLRESRQHSGQQIAVRQTTNCLGGLWCSAPPGDTNTLTRANVIIGTASYTAPEQLMDDEVDGRADQYALAGSAFHLLTGSPPFAHFNPAVMISKHLNERPPRPSDIRPDLTDFDAIFGRALAKDPVDRFRRCRDFAKALESTGGTRSHIRGASDFPPDAPDRQDTATTALLAAPEPDTAAPTKPAAHAASDSGSHDALAPPDVLPEAEVHDATPSVEPTVSDAVGDDAAAKSRRLLHTAALAGTIMVVVLAWFFGVRASALGL